MDISRPRGLRLDVGLREDSGIRFQGRSDADRQKGGLGEELDCRGLCRDWGTFFICVVLRDLYILLHDVP